MKKTFALLFALVMCLSLVACGGGNEPAKNPYEKYAKYEELFIYLEAGDWENANTYIQTYFGMADDDPVDTDTSPSTQVTPTETTVPETTVPETTAEPEPVYETIEITMDNWQEYLEFRQTEGTWKEDAFGDTEEYAFGFVFAIKEEYLDKINTRTIDVAFSYSYFKEFRYFEADFENRTFALGDVVDRSLLGGHDYKMGEGVSDAYKLSNTANSIWYINCYKDSNMYVDINLVPMFAWPEPLDIVRIQGTIEIQTN